MNAADPFGVGQGAREMLRRQDEAEEKRRLDLINRARAELQERAKSYPDTPQGRSGRDVVDTELAALSYQETLIRTEHAQRRRSYSW